MEFFIFSLLCSTRQLWSPSTSQFNAYWGKAGCVCEADHLQCQNKMSLQLHFTLTPLVITCLFTGATSMRTHNFILHYFSLHLFLVKFRCMHLLISFQVFCSLFISFLRLGRSLLLVGIHWANITSKFQRAWLTLTWSIWSFYLELN